MAASSNVTWVQGQDLTFSLMYREGATAQTAIPVDLSTGYTVRMDIVSTLGARLFTFNSADLVDADPLVVGNQADTAKEAVLSNGTGTSNIDISISRSLTLPGGELYSLISGTPPVLTFFGDIFLRHTASNKQWKFLTVNITVEKSYTLWP